MRHKFRVITFGILGLICLASCSSHAAIGNAYAVGVYQLTGDDEGFSIRFPDGRRRAIVLTEQSDLVARNAMRVLRYSIFISTQKRQTANDFSSSPIFFVGRIGKVIAGKAGYEKNGVRYEPAPRRIEFELRGWFIKVPFIEYPQVPDYEPYVAPRKRTTLEPKDFKESIDPRSIHYDKARRIYWIGLNPSAGP